MIRYMREVQRATKIWEGRVNLELGFWKVTGEKVNPSWTLAGHGDEWGCRRGTPRSWPTEFKMI